MVLGVCGVSLCVGLHSLGPQGFLFGLECGLWGPWGYSVSWPCGTGSLQVSRVIDWARLRCLVLVTLSGQYGVSGNSGLSLWVRSGPLGPLGSLGHLGTHLFHRGDTGQLLEVRLAKAVVSEACGVPLCAELRSVGPLGFLSQQESGLWGFFCELAWGVWSSRVSGVIL